MISAQEWRDSLGYPGAEIVKAKCGKGSATLSLGAG